MKKISKLVFLIAIVGLIFTLAGCEEWLLEVDTEYYTVDISGRMIDAKDTTVSTGKGLDSVTVKLLDESGEEVPGVDDYTTGSDGYFSFGGLEPGSYTITGTKSEIGTTAYAFLPYEFEVASTTNISGIEIPGVPFDTETDDYAITIVVMWDDDFDDVDAHLTYPESGSAVASGLASQYYSSEFFPYDIPYAAGDGFAPESAFDGGASRYNVYHANKTGQEADANVVLDRDDIDGSGPETITIREAIDWTDTDTITIDDADDPNDGSEWRGVMQYYLDAWYSGSLSEDPYLVTAQGETEKAAANPKVWVLQTFADYDGDGTADDPGYDIMGIYDLPSYTNIDQASILRIHAFHDGAYPYFVIYPDIHNAIEQGDYEYDPSDTDTYPSFRGVEDVKPVTSRRRAR